MKTAVAVAAIGFAIVRYVHSVTIIVAVVVFHAKHQY
jgi:hypothetical protein